MKKTKGARADVPAAPSAERRPRPFARHGITVADDYAWLRADNWQEVLKRPRRLPADIRDHLKAENAYARAMLAPTARLRKTLIAEMRARIKEDDSSVPSPDGAFAYFERYVEGGQHPRIGREPRGGGEPQFILDGDSLAEGLPFFDFGDAQHSPDHRLEAWSADTKGSEYYVIRVRDWATGEDRPDRIEESDGEAIWTRDSRAFYYIRLDDNHRPRRVYRHRLGSAQADDELVYEEPDAGWYMDIRRSSTGRYCVIGGGDSETSEQRLIDLNDPDARPVLVAAREKNVRYSVDDCGEELYILTNADGAIDFKIMKAPLAAPRRANWRDFIAYREGTYLLYFSLFSGHMARLERENALPRIVIRDLETHAEHVIAFAEEAYSLFMESGYEFDTTTLRYSYSSMTTPSEIWDYDMATRMRVLRKRREIPSGHDPADYVTRRIFATADDGAEVPVSILHRRDAKLDGSAPLLLYGYGSYGHASSASFSSNRLSLVDRGFVYAIAHVRGGAEKGWGWYLDGKREKKTNSFDDFAAVARALIARKYTSAKRIVGHGGSAGGLLMGAVANRAGELFAGIVAEVPFVDVVNTMLDDSLPLTPPEWLEWGNPITDEQAFRTILAYSPYDNVAAKDYPAILAMGGLTDPRVTYWEPAKWIARLRATMTSGGPVLLRTNMGAGHGGASGRFERLKEVALAYAFAIWAVARSEA